MAHRDWNCCQVFVFGEWNGVWVKCAALNDLIAER